jgi:hypothetical protein
MEIPRSVELTRYIPELVLLPKDRVGALALPFGAFIVSVSVLGRSALTSDLKVGCAAEPLEGPAKTVFSVSVARVNVRVPELVIGEPVME